MEHSSLKDEQTFSLIRKVEQKSGAGARAQNVVEKKNVSNFFILNVMKPKNLTRGIWLEVKQE